ncbi:MAG: glycosyltransferase [Caldilineaceae bacterium]
MALNRLPQNSAVSFGNYLEDVRPTVARSWISIVPLRIGGGSRLKILESLALGTPVVSTAKGAEGLTLKPGVDLLIGDSAESFADATVRLLEDASLRAKISHQGRETVTAHYDWQGIGQKRYVPSSTLSMRGGSHEHRRNLARGWSGVPCAGSPHLATGRRRARADLALHSSAA